MALINVPSVTPDFLKKSLDVLTYHMRKTETERTEIAQLQPYLDRKSLTTLVHVSVISRTGYCNAVYMGLPLKAI